MCHGTAGNGYAFLRLHALSGEQLWLQRARRFGMHAIGQAVEEKKQKKQGFYSLFTGDMGLAVYLVECLQGGSGYFPVVEGFAF